jgi:hypothetical protein
MLYFPRIQLRGNIMRTPRNLLKEIIHIRKRVSETAEKLREKEKVFHSLFEMPKEYLKKKSRFQ